MPIDQLRTLYQLTCGWPIAVQMVTEYWKKTGEICVPDDLSDMLDHIVWEGLSQQDQRYFMELALVDTFSVEYVSRIFCQEINKMNWKFYLKKTQKIKQSQGKDVYWLHPLLKMHANKKFQELSVDNKKKMWKRAAVICRDIGNTKDAAVFYANTGEFQSLLQLYFTKNDLKYLLKFEQGRIIKDLISVKQQEYLKKYPKLVLKLAFQILLEGDYYLFQQYFQLAGQLVEAARSRRMLKARD
jgi:hypothetical protein